MWKLLIQKCLFGGLLFPLNHGLSKVNALSVVCFFLANSSFCRVRRKELVSLVLIIYIDLRLQEMLHIQVVDSYSLHVY